MKKFRFLYIAAAALLFAACANEEDGIGNNGPVAATVKADISILSLTNFSSVRNNGMFLMFSRSMISRSTIVLYTLSR